MSEAVSAFVANIKQLLSEGDVTSAISAFDDSQNESEVKDQSWDLIPVITQHLSQENKERNEKLFQCCQRLINTIAERSNPEEVLLQFIEEIEEASDDVKLCTLLEPLQVLLKRMSHKKISTLAWCFNAIQTYVSHIEVENDFKLIGEEERLLLDCDPFVDRVTSLYMDIVLFYDNFMRNSSGLIESAPQRKKLICKFLVQLLGKPLSHLDLRLGEKPKNRGRRIAENLLDKILAVLPDPFVFLELLDDKEEPNELEMPGTLSLAVFYYMIMSEGVLLEKTPKVYNQIYLFQHTLPFVRELLQQSHHLCIEKGMDLMSAMLRSVQGIQLPYLLLDSHYHSGFCEHLSNIIIYNENETTRKAALKIFEQYIKSFETRGQYLLVLHLMDTLNHSGLIGFIITHYKDMIVKASREGDTLSPYCTNERLRCLLSRFCHLPQKEETDLIEHSDQIMASLNLLRYLVIRDRDNVTGIWDHVKVLEADYLEPLKRGIILARGHYKLKVKELEEEQGKGDDGNKKSKVMVTIAGQLLPEMPTSEKLKVLFSSLTAFDVMDSLLCRLNECIQMH